MSGRQLFYKQFAWTFVLQRSHGFVIVPDNMSSQLLVQIQNTPECFPIIEIPLVISMTAFYFPIVPGCPRRNQHMLYAKTA